MAAAGIIYIKDKIHIVIMGNFPTCKHLFKSVGNGFCRVSMAAPAGGYGRIALLCFLSAVKAHHSHIIRDFISMPAQYRTNSYRHHIIGADYSLGNMPSCYHILNSLLCRA